jgi:hypothetical protein
MIKTFRQVRDFIYNQRIKPAHEGIPGFSAATIRHALNQNPELTLSKRTITELLQDADNARIAKKAEAYESRAPSAVEADENEERRKDMALVHRDTFRRISRRECEKRYGEQTWFDNPFVADLTYQTGRDFETNTPRFKNPRNVHVTPIQGSSNLTEILAADQDKDVVWITTRQGKVLFGPFEDITYLGSHSEYHLAKVRQDGKQGIIDSEGEMLYGGWHDVGGTYTFITSINNTAHTIATCEDSHPYREAVTSRGEISPDSRFVPVAVHDDVLAIYRQHRSDEETHHELKVFKDDGELLLDKTFTEKSRDDFVPATLRIIPTAKPLVEVGLKVYGEVIQSELYDPCTQQKLA